MTNKVIYIQQFIKGSGYIPPKDMYPNFFTYGFGGRLGRIFRKYNPTWTVEVWRLDSSIDKLMETDFEGVHFKIFPAGGSSKIGIYSYKFFKNLRNLPKNTILNVQNIHDSLLYQVLLFSPSHLIITAQHHGDNHPYFKLKNSKGYKRIKAGINCIVEKALLKKVSYFFIIDVDHVDFLARTVRNLPGKYSIQPLGIDFSMYRKIPKAEACRDLGLDPEKRYLFYLGQYFNIKEVDRLCEVYRKVNQEHPEVQLFVAGGAPSDMYYNNIKECGAIDFGRIPNNELSSYYSAADVYVCMTFRPDYFGGIGLAMLEAMACGTPVVCKSLENIPEKIRQFVGMMPSDENEMISEILDVLTKRENYSDCRKYVEELYDYSVIQENTARIYSILLQNNDK